MKLADNWGHLLANYGVLKVFLIYGIVFVVMVLVGSIWMVNPPAGYAPKGWQPPVATKTSKPAGTVDFEPMAMLSR